MPKKKVERYVQTEYTDEKGNDLYSGPNNMLYIYDDDKKEMIAVRPKSSNPFSNNPHLPKQYQRPETPPETINWSNPPSTPKSTHSTPKKGKKKKVEGEVDIPLFGKTEIAIPEYFATPVMKEGKIDHYELVNPLTKARNLSTRRHKLSIKLIRKPTNETILMEHQIEPIPLSMFRPKDREIINTHFDKVKEYENTPAKQIPPAKPFKNKPRGNPEVMDKNIEKNRQKGIQPNITLNVYQKKHKGNQPQAQPQAQPQPISQPIPQPQIEEKEKRKYQKHKESKYATEEERLAALRQQKKEWAAQKRIREKRAEAGGAAADMEGEGIFDTIKDTAKKAGRTIRKTFNALVNGISDYSPKVRNILNQYGGNVITSMVIGRTPVPSLLTNLLGIASGGEFTKNLQNSPYDQLFHLFVRMELDGGTILTLEKNEVINMDIDNPIPPNTETQDVNLSGSYTPTELLNNTKNYMGGKFFTYSARDNNCQDFILSLFNANNIGSQANKDFIKQDTKQLFGSNVGLRKLSNTITDIGAKANILTQGAGLADDIITHFNKDNKEMLKLKNSLVKHLKTEKKVGGKIDSDSDSDSDSETKGEGINFNKIKWGTFTRQFKEYKKKHPSIKSLEQFAHYIINNKKDFQEKTFRRAEFYLNVLDKKNISSNNNMVKRGKAGSDETQFINRDKMGKGLFASAAGEGLFASAAGEGLYASAQGRGIHHIHHHIHHIQEGGSLKSIGRDIKNAFSKHNADTAAHYLIPAATSALGGAAGSALGGPLGGVAGSAGGAYAGQEIDKALGIQGATSFGKGIKKHTKGSPEALEWGRRMREARLRKQNK